MSPAVRALRLMAQKRRAEAVAVLEAAGGHQAAINLLLTGHDDFAVTVLQGEVKREGVAAAQARAPEAVRAPGGGDGA